MEHIYKYAVLRVMPDPRRGEVVNIGLAVFHADTVDVHVAPSLGKIIALDPSVDIEQYQKLPDALKQWATRFDSVEDRINAIRHFGMVTISELGQFRVTEGVTYAEHVKRLMQTLVVPKARDTTNT